jgi:hypothetical protein
LHACSPTLCQPLVVKNKNKIRKESTSVLQACFKAASVLKPEKTYWISIGPLSLLTSIFGPTPALINAPVKIFLSFHPGLPLHLLVTTGTRRTHSQYRGMGSAGSRNAAASAGEKSPLLRPNKSAQK